MSQLDNGDQVEYEGDEDWEIRGVFDTQVTLYHPERDKWTTALKENLSQV